MSRTPRSRHVGAVMTASRRRLTRMSRRIHPGCARRGSQLRPVSAVPSEKHAKATRRGTSGIPVSPDWRGPSRRDHEGYRANEEQALSHKLDAAGPVERRGRRGSRPIHDVLALCPREYRMNATVRQPTMTILWHSKETASYARRTCNARRTFNAIHSQFPTSADPARRSARLLPALARLQGRGAGAGGQHDGGPTSLQLGGPVRARQRVRARATC